MAWRDGRAWVARASLGMLDAPATLRAAQAAHAASSRTRAWRATYYVLAATVALTATLNMLRIRGGFLTNHLADFVVPVWMYLAARGLYSPTVRPTMIMRTLGRSPLIAASGLFAASALTEVSQHYWPHGIFPGRFDPLDLLTYAIAAAACYAAERRWPLFPRPA